MGKCSSKEKRGRKLVPDKGNKGSVSSSESSSPRASQAQAPASSTPAQATPCKVLEVTQAVPTPTVSPAKLKEAKKSRTRPVTITTKVEDPAEATTSQSLEETELLFGEELQTTTSSSAPAGLRRRNVVIKKEANQSDYLPSDVRSESFHDAIDDLPDFPVLDSSFDESEFRTPIGRLSTDSSYSSDKSSSFSERERAVTSHFGFSPKSKEVLAIALGATPKQQHDTWRSSREEKPRDVQINLLSATESQASNQEAAVGKLGVVLPIHPREEHFAAPREPPPLVTCDNVVVHTKAPPTEEGKIDPLLPNLEPRQIHAEETLKDMDAESPTESFEHIEASDAYFSEDDMHPRKSDSSYVILDSEKTETATGDSSPCSLEATMTEQSEGFANHLDTLRPSNKSESY